MSNYWNVQAALCGGKGKKRSNNEDAFYFNGKYQSIQDMDNDITLAKEFPLNGCLFAICDGMGGHANGEVASYTAVSGMTDLQQRLMSEDFSASLQKWCLQADELIAKRTEGGGCTLVLLYCKNNTVYCAHIGDSRAYLYHDGALAPLTKDHSRVQSLISAGFITPEEARTHPQRNIINRFLGMHGEIRCEPSFAPNHFPCRGDRYLLCTDGITDMLSDSQLEALCKAHKSSLECANAIYNAAMEMGGKDNLTILTLDMVQENCDRCMKNRVGENTLDEEADDPYLGDGESSTVIFTSIQVKQQDQPSVSLEIKAQF